jgi:hypothetical protein
VLSTIDKHKDRVIPRAITPKTKWNPGELEGGALSPQQKT